jgi:hypothetical protein
MQGYALPHNAKGIEGEGFAVAFGDDKVVFIAKPSRDDEEGEALKHYTIHAGLDSGVIDLHETIVSADGQKHYRTIFALRKDDFPALFQELAPMLHDLVGLIRRLRPGWMKHRNIGIARGVEPVSDADITAVTRKRKRRLSLDADLYQRNVFVPDYLEEVYEFPDGNFTLFHRGRNIGMGFKQTDAEGMVRLFWIKRRDLMRFSHDWQEKVITAFRRISIPPEHYAKYPFLHS